MKAAKKKPMAPRDAAQIGPRQLKDTRSVEFAWQTLALLKTCFQSKEISAKNWRETLGEADHYHIYDRIPPEKPYGSLDAMLQAEIGETVDSATEKVKQFEARATKQGERTDIRAARKSTQDGRAKQNEVGETTQRYLDALSTKHPDLLERVNAGELKPKTAARLAGIVKVKTDLEQARFWFGKLSPADRKKFLAAPEA